MAEEKELRSAAVELNEVLGLEPPINVKAKVSVLTEAMKGALELITPKDKFTDETQIIIDELGEGGGNGEEEKEEPTLAESIEAAESRSELIEIAKSNDEFKAIRGKLSSYKTSKDLAAALLEIVNAEDVEKSKKAAEIHKRNIADKPVTVGKEKTGGSKVTAERFKPKKSTGAERVDFLTPLITSGKYTKAELVEKANKEFPDVSISTLQTILTDAKNPKYNKFAKLVVQAEDGTMSFKK